MHLVQLARVTVAYTDSYAHMHLLFLPTEPSFGGGYTACRFLLTASIGGFGVIWISRLFCRSGFRRLRVGGLSITFK